MLFLFIQYLPEFNKKKYKQLEAAAKKKDKTDTSNKFNSLGVSYDQLEREQSEQRQAISRMESDIENTVQRLSSNVDSKYPAWVFLNIAFIIRHGKFIIVSLWSVGHNRKMLPPNQVLFYFLLWNLVGFACMLSFLVVKCFGPILWFCELHHLWKSCNNFKNT